MLKLVSSNTNDEVDLYFVRKIGILRKIQERIFFRYGWRIGQSMLDHAVTHGEITAELNKRDKQLIYLFAKIMDSRGPDGDLRIVHSTPLSGVDRIRHNMRQHMRKQAELQQKYINTSEEEIV